MGCQNTKVVAENVQTENKQHIMISYSWDSGQITGFVLGWSQNSPNDRFNFDH